MPWLRWRKKLGIRYSAASNANPATFPSSEDLGIWLEWEAKRLGFEAEPLETTLHDLEIELVSAHPSLLRISDSAVLAILTADRRTLRVLTPALTIRRVRISEVSRLIREPAERPVRAEFERLLRDARIPSSRQAKTLRLAAV